MAKARRAAKRTYNAVITKTRLRSSSFKSRTLTEEVLSDRQRIITSTAFRRLQTKAQVFSLEHNAAVRTRLTHTLEVSVYGAIVATRTFDLLLKKKLITEDNRFPFIGTVENACLLHDVGNPPFGHLGEYAIQAWFRDRERKGLLVELLKGVLGVDETLIEQYYPSFECFDGNPQGFRYVTKLQWMNDEYGLNLSCGLLGAFVKYLDSCEHKRPFGKKIGFFEIDLPYVLKLWKALGLNTENGRPAERYPLTFLMEAADDIAYCVSDIEDAIEKRIVSQRDFLEYMDRRGGDLHSTIMEHKFFTKPRPSGPSTAQFMRYRVLLTRLLGEIAAGKFVAHAPQILDGTADTKLLDSSPKALTILEALRTFSKERIFFCREAVSVELSGFHVISRLLDCFLCLFELDKNEFQRLLKGSMSSRERPLEQRLAVLLPMRHKLAYEHATKLAPELEGINRVHLILDYITGMTDSHAVRVFNVLSGSGAGVVL